MWEDIQRSLVSIREITGINAPRASFNQALRKQFSFSSELLVSTEPDTFLPGNRVAPYYSLSDGEKVSGINTRGILRRLYLAHKKYPEELTKISIAILHEAPEIISNSEKLVIGITELGTLTSVPRKNFRARLDTFFLKSFFPDPCAMQKNIENLYDDMQEKSSYQCKLFPETEALIKASTTILRTGNTYVGRIEKNPSRFLIPVSSAVSN